MKALKPIATGEELFNDYGPLPRSDLLRRYGYITPNYAKYDVVEIPQNIVLEAVGEETSASEANINARLEYLDEEGVTDSGYDIAKRGADETLLESISLELLTLVAALAMPEADYLRLKERGKLPKIGAIATPMARVLRRSIQKRISQYQTTAEEDERLLAEIRGLQIQDQRVRRRQMAIEVRLAEKKILMETESALSGLLEGEQNAGQTKKRKVG
jgi:N-lysine methyltransferase SETD6